MGKKYITVEKIKLLSTSKKANSNKESGIDNMQDEILKKDRLVDLGKEDTTIRKTISSEVCKSLKDDGNDHLEDESLMKDCAYKMHKEETSGRNTIQKWL